MNNKNQNILDADYSSDISKELNGLLSDLQVYYQNLRGLHWNVSGRFFFGLHAKFEELYNEVNQTIDEIAERILTLGNVPLHSFADYQMNSRIKSVLDVSDGEEAVKAVVNNLRILLESERAILGKAANAGDEGTVAILSGLIASQEKQHWMMQAWLK